jgi:hypothetical protein
MSGFGEYMLPIQRRAILNYLVASKGFELNERLLMRVLEDNLIGVDSYDDVRTITDWLVERGLVEARAPKSDLHDAGDRMLAMTEKGLDVAQGYSELPDIQRSPRKVAERMRRIVSGEETV